MLHAFSTMAAHRLICPNTLSNQPVTMYSEWRLSRGADKSLAFPICSATKRIFLGWVKEVTTTKS
jgi:hypothetical protein